jgi:alanyl-tRNA synthetase
METLADPADIVLGSCPGKGKVGLVAAFTPGVVDQGIQAGKFIGQIAKLCGGRKPDNLAGALEKAKSQFIVHLFENGN